MIVRAARECGVRNRVAGDESPNSFYSYVGLTTMTLKVAPMHAIDFSVAPMKCGLLLKKLPQAAS
jgi:hypothetical protein